MAIETGDGVSGAVCLSVRRGRGFCLLAGVGQSRIPYLYIRLGTQIENTTVRAPRMPYRCAVYHPNTLALTFMCAPALTHARAHARGYAHGRLMLTPALAPAQR